MMETKQNQTEQEKVKRILEEMQKVKNKTTTNDDNIVEQKISLYQKLNKQLSNMVGDHREMLRQIRSQPIDAVEKLLEQIEQTKT